MYYLAGYKYCLTNIVKLAEKFGERQVSNDVAIKKAYLNFLAEHQSHVPMPSKCRMFFVEEPYTKSVLLNLINKDGCVDNSTDKVVGEKDFNKNEENLLMHIILQGVDLIKTYDSDLEKLFSLIINYIVIKRGSEDIRCGSTKGALGVVWCPGYLDWEVGDAAEFLVHNLTHQLIFFDALSEPYFKNGSRLDLSSVMCCSALSEVNRPIERAVHSVFIAHEILEFRKRLPEELQTGTYHIESNQLLNQMVKSIDCALDAHKSLDIFQKHVIEKLLICKYSSSKSM